MALEPGARLGPHEILGLLGSGGMGEVYRARDTKLNRDVAIKVLPPQFALDVDRLARFKREAQVLASLNHPHIGAIYGFEESESTQALILELVEGPTLADRIMRGPIPFNEALPIARQIAEALAAAHEQGIIHRDLKPANIKVRDDGTVKVLDFGLARVAEAAGTANSQLTMSPTITSPALMTGIGMLLGTATYMSPEQARGRPADRRADVWAFGCVLYEMLTGKRTFDGEDVAVVLASVIKTDPDFAALPSDLPVAIVMLLRHCLEKEPRSRVADIGTASFVLNHAAQLAEHPDVATAAAVAAPRSTWKAVAGLSVAAIVGALGAGAGVWMLTRSAPPAIVRSTIAADGTAALRVSNVDSEIAITPDGSRIVYRGANQLLVRALNQLDSSVLLENPALRGQL